MNHNMLVSVICNTYNHEKYIRDTLESIVTQKTNFQYEILVHDDASTDNTAQIIEEYEKKYPNLVKPIYQFENQYSKKQGIVYDIQFQRASGKYIALCEGDDYWIDEYKLQKQYDALEKNPNVDICATAAIKVKSETKKVISRFAPKNEDMIITPEDVILGGGGYVATNSLMYRRIIDFNRPEFRNYLMYDYTLQILGSLRGGMLYLNDTTAAYRSMAKNSWTSKMNQDKEAAMNWTNRVNRMLEKLNEETEGVYINVIKERIRINKFMNLYRMGDIKRMKSEEYVDLYRKLNVIKKIIIYIKKYSISLEKRGEKNNS